MALDQGRAQSLDPVFQLAQQLGIDLSVPRRDASGDVPREDRAVEREIEERKGRGIWSTLLEGLKWGFIPGYAGNQRRIRQLEDFQRQQDITTQKTQDERRYNLFNDLLNQQQAEQTTRATQENARKVDDREFLQSVVSGTLTAGRDVSPDVASQLGIAPEVLAGAKTKTAMEKLVEELGLAKSSEGKEFRSILQQEEMSEAEKRAAIELEKQKGLQNFIHGLTSKALTKEQLDAITAESAARSKGNYLGVLGAMDEGGPKPATGAGIREASKQANTLIAFIGMSDPAMGANLKKEFDAFLATNPTDAEIATFTSGLAETVSKIKPKR